GCEPERDRDDLHAPERDRSRLRQHRGLELHAIRRADPRKRRDRAAPVARSRHDGDVVLRELRAARQSGHRGGAADRLRLAARYGAFSPHTNIGYLFQGGAFQNNAVLATVGFDHLMAPWATLAVDVVSQLQVGESKLRLPGPVTYDAPFVRTIDVTNIPNQRDDQINGSLGFKFITGSGITLVGNTLWPLDRAGLRPNVLWTAGLE